MLRLTAGVGLKAFTLVGLLIIDCEARPCARRLRVPGWDWTCWISAHRRFPAGILSGFVFDLAIASSIAL